MNDLDSITKQISALATALTAAAKAKPVRRVKLIVVFMRVVS